MKTKEIQLRYKGNRCAICGLSVEDMMSRFGTFNRMTEFHHIDPNKKSNNYKNLIRRQISSEQLDELDKCILLCSTCHGLVHAQNCKGTVELNLKIDERTVTQFFEGQFVFDFLEKKIKFLTDKRILLNQYHVRLGNKENKNYIGIELDTGHFFSDILQKLQEFKFLEVVDPKTNEILMQAQQIDYENIMLKQNIKFPFFNYNLVNTTKNNQFLWIRNGLIFTKDNILRTEGTISANIRLI